MSTAENHLPIEALLQNTAWLERLARGLIKDPAGADDLVQETCLAALERPPRDVRSLAPWLEKVLRNFARVRHRAEASRRGREAAVARPECAGGDPSGVLEKIETQQRLMGFVLALPEPHRSIILRRFFEDLSPREIAAARGEAESTVRWRIAEAIERLRARLDRDSGGDRKAWRLALAPVAGLPSALTAGGKAAAGGAQVTGAASTAAAASGAATAVAGAGASSIWITVGGSIMAQKAILVGAASLVVLAAGVGIGVRVAPAKSSVQELADLRSRNAQAAQRIERLESQLLARGKALRNLLSPTGRSGAAKAPAAGVPEKAPGAPAADPSPAVAEREEASAGSESEVLAKVLALFANETPGPEIEVRHEDLEKTLERHQREPAYLEAGALLSSDPEASRALIAEALEKDPNSPSALLALLDLQQHEGAPAEAIGPTIEALKKADPTNAIPGCYEALGRLRGGDLPGALGDLRAALANPRFNNYDAKRIGYLEQFYQEAGNQETYAKALAFSATRIEELLPLRDLAAGVAGESERLRESGDFRGALEYAAAGLELGSKVSSSARSLIEEAVGMVLEGQALKAERKVREEQGDSGRLSEIDGRLAGLKQRRERYQKISGGIAPALREMSPPEISRYFDRLYAEGEAAAALELPSLKTALATGNR